MTVDPMNPLETFLENPGQSHPKESILMNRLIYDFKLAAGLRGYHLYSYTSDVDHERFDIIFDDQDQIKKIQVKTVMCSSMTSTWHIHKRILRPQLYAIDKLGFEFSPTGDGVQGGVILMELSISGSKIEVKYYYTDIIIIVCFIHGIISRRHRSSQSAIERVYSDLHSGISNETVTIPKSCFIRTASAEQVLALSGFHNNISTCCWIHNLLMYSAFKFSDGRYPINMPENSMRESIVEELKKCTDDDLVFA